MRYSEARAKIKTGDLLAWSARISFSSWYDIQVSAIRIFGGTEYTHVGVAWAEHGRVFVIEAVGAGVRIMPLSREMPFFWAPRPNPLGDEALEWLFSKIGNRYESKWKMVLNKLWPQHLDQNDNWYCSELLLEAYRRDGEHLSGTDPKDVVRAAAEKWGPIVYVTGD